MLLRFFIEYNIAYFPSKMLSVSRWINIFLLLGNCWLLHFLFIQPLICQVMDPWVLIQDTGWLAFNPNIPETRTPLTQLQVITAVELIQVVQWLPVIRFQRVILQHHATVCRPHSIRSDPSINHLARTTGRISLLFLLNGISRLWAIRFTANFYLCTVNVSLRLSVKYKSLF